MGMGYIEVIERFKDGGEKFLAEQEALLLASKTGDSNSSAPLAHPLVTDPVIGKLLAEREALPLQNNPSYTWLEKFLVEQKALPVASKRIDDAPVPLFVVDTFLKQVPRSISQFYLLYFTKEPVFQEEFAKEMIPKVRFVRENLIKILKNFGCEQLESGTDRLVPPTDGRIFIATDLQVRWGKIVKGLPSAQIVAIESFLASKGFVFNGQHEIISFVFPQFSEVTEELGAVLTDISSITQDPVYLNAQMKNIRELFSGVSDDFLKECEFAKCEELIPLIAKNTQKFKDLLDLLKTITHSVEDKINSFLLSVNYEDCKTVKTLEKITADKMRTLKNDLINVLNRQTLHLRDKNKKYTIQGLIDLAKEKMAPEDYQTLVHIIYRDLVGPFFTQNGVLAVEKSLALELGLNALELEENFNSESLDSLVEVNVPTSFERQENNPQFKYTREAIKMPYLSKAAFFGILKLFAPSIEGVGDGKFSIPDFEKFLKAASSAETGIPQVMESLSFSKYF